AAPGAALQVAFSEAWFDVCSVRIDAFKDEENRLTTGLRTLCGDKIRHARAELAAFAALPAAPSPDPLAFFLAPAERNPASPPGVGGPLERSVQDLVQEQARRL